MTALTPKRYGVRRFLASMRHTVWPLTKALWRVRKRRYVYSVTWQLQGAKTPEGTAAMIANASRLYESASVQLDAIIRDADAKRPA